MKQICILLLFAISACSPSVHRGNFSLISTEPIQDNFEVLAESKVNGKACFNQLKSAVFLADGVFDASVLDALSKVQGATILLDSEFRDTGTCIVVSGIPARSKGIILNDS